MNLRKVKLAIIGQGRSGKNIHGKYFRSEANTYYNVKYVVDEDAFRREVAEQIYPGCTTFSECAFSFLATFLFENFCKISQPISNHLQVVVFLNHLV